MYFMRLLIRSVSFVLLVCGHVLAVQSSPQAMGRIEAAPNAESISVWERMLQADPNNMDLRIRLVNYYAENGPSDNYFQQALWIVQHHPESPAATVRPSRTSFKAGLTEADYSLLKAAWEQAIIDQADSAKVLYNSGIFFTQREPLRAAHLLEQARQLDPDNIAIWRTEASLYAAAFQIAATTSSNVSNSPSPPDFGELRAEIAASSDPALLSEVGSLIVGNGLNSTLKAKGMELINRAIALDPANEAWKAALQRATAPPAPPPPPPPPPAAPPLGAVRIGNKVAEANLIRKVDPVYPSLALQARVSGIVEFTATINEDGHIQNLQLVRGHPLLVNAAKDAVLQYIYRPTLLNGNAVSVIASVIVPFELPPQ